MSTLVLGSNGQLGRALCALIPEATAFGRETLDLADPEAVRAFGWSDFDTVINAAAYTAVDAAETPQGSSLAWAVNATAPELIAEACARVGARLVHVSTDYVFDGAALGPIGEDAPMSPLSAYGASKAAGDVAVLAAGVHAWIVRPSWVIGDGANFVRTMATLALRGVSPVVVADQVGRPTFAPDLAAGIVRLLDREPQTGVYHLTNSGLPGTWAEIARRTFVAAGRDGDDVGETTTSAYFADKPGSAARPMNSVLDLTKATKAGLRLPDWRQSLRSYLNGEIGHHNRPAKELSA